MTITKVSTGLIEADAASVNLNIDENTLYIDVTTNRVGIGNTNPATALDVTGSVTADGLTVDSTNNSGNTGTPTIVIKDLDTAVSAGQYTGAVEFETSDASNSGVNSYIRSVMTGTGGAGSLTFGTGFAGSLADRVLIDDNGDISFYNTAGTSQALFWDASAESLGIGTTSLTTSDGSNVELSAATSSRVILASTGIGGRKWTMATGTTGSLDFYDYDASAYRMRIDAAGNVGIGTSTTTAIRLTATTATANHVGLQVENSNTADSFGIIVKAGNDENDYTADFRKRDNTTIMRIRGDGSVGIGTSSPAQILHLRSAAPAIEFDDSGFATVRGRISSDEGNLVLEADYQNSRANSNIAFKVDNTERMRIDSSGDLNLVNTGLASLNFTTDGSLDYARITGGKSGSGVGELQFWTYSGGMSRAATIDSNGNLLVGTISSSSNTAGIKLTAAGTATFVRSGVQPVYINRLTNDGDLAVFAKDGAPVGSIGVKQSDAATGDGELFVASGNTGLFFDDLASPSNYIRPCNASGALRDNIVDLGKSDSRFKDLYLSDTAHASTYRLKNGTTTTGGLFHEKDLLGSGTSYDTSLFAETGNALHFMVNGSATPAGTFDTSGNLLVGTTSTADTDIGAKIFSDARMVQGFAGLGLVDLHDFYRGTDGSLTRVGNIRTNGTSTTYNTSSDQRLKENIADADDAGSKIDAIQVRKFDWKADGAHQDYGMVAQELQVVAPEAVAASEDPEEMMGVDYSKLVPMMLKEIQSLRARVSELES